MTRDECDQMVKENIVKISNECSMCQIYSYTLGVRGYCKGCINSIQENTLGWVIRRVAALEKAQERLAREQVRTAERLAREQARTDERLARLERIKHDKR